MEETQTATVTDKMTVVQTATRTETMTDRVTMTEVSTLVQPTTYVKTWVSTEIQDRVTLFELDPKISDSRSLIDQDASQHCDCYHCRRQDNPPDHHLPLHRDCDRHCHRDAKSS